MSIWQDKTTFMIAKLTKFFIWECQVFWLTIFFCIGIVHMVGTNWVTFSKISTNFWLLWLANLVWLIMVCDDAYFIKFLHWRQNASLSFPKNYLNGLKSLLEVRKLFFRREAVLVVQFLKKEEYFPPLSMVHTPFKRVTNFNAPPFFVKEYLKQYAQTQYPSLPVWIMTQSGVVLLLKWTIFQGLHAFPVESNFKSSFFVSSTYLITHSNLQNDAGFTPSFAFDTSLVVPWMSGLNDFTRIKNIFILDWYCFWWNISVNGALWLCTFLS